MPTALIPPRVLGKIWLGDPFLRALPLATQAVLVHLHALAVSLDTWPQMPSDPLTLRTLARMMGLRPRGLAGHLARLRATNDLVITIPDDPTQLRLRPLETFRALFDARQG